MPLDGVNTINASLSDPVSGRTQNIIRGAVRGNVPLSTVLSDTNGYNTPGYFNKGTQTITRALVDSQATLAYADAAGPVGTSESMGKLNGVDITNPLVQEDALNTTVSGVVVVAKSIGYNQLVDGRWVDADGDIVTPSGKQYSVKEQVATSGDLSVPNPRTQDQNYNTRLGLSNRTESLGIKTG